MTKFNPENKVQLSYEEMLEPAMKITEQADADQYLKDYVKWMSKDLSEEQATKKICLSNLGYFSYYCSPEVRERVQKLFGCEHPLFGKNTQPTVEESLAAGFNRAMQERRKRSQV